MKEPLRYLAQKFTRSREETAQLGDWWSTLGKSVLLSIFLGFTFGMLLPFFSEELDNWQLGAPSIGFDSSQWRVLYQDGKKSESCGVLANENPECFAHIENARLWSSSSSRSDATHSNRVRELTNQTYWLGLEIGEDELRYAQEMKAKHFILGEVIGQYRIWVDGDLVESGSYREAGLPVVLDLPHSKFSQKSLRIVAEIFKGEGERVLDPLGGKGGEGLATASQVKRYLGRHIFLTKSRPWLFLGLNLIIGILFLVFWGFSKKKQEYAYLGVYASVGAVTQLLSIDFIAARFGPEWTNHLLLTMICYQGGFGCFLGLAFARTRRILFQLGIPFLLALPWVFYGLDQPLSNIWVNRLVFSFYVFGGMVCCLQASWLSLERRTLPYLPFRLGRLIFFGVALVALSVTHLLLVDSFWYPFANFVFLILFSILMLRDYRDSERLGVTAPVSDFHRRPVLPTRLSGLCASFRIKGSETLFLCSAKKGDPKRLLNTCSSHLATGILAHNGVVLRMEGAEVVAFFPDENAGGASETLIQTVLKVGNELQILERSFQDQGLLPLKIGLGFRAGVERVALRPIWDQLAGVRIPTWVEVDGGNGLKRTRKLSQLKKAVDGVDTRESHLWVAQSAREELNAHVPGDAWVSWEGTSGESSVLLFSRLNRAAGDSSAKTQL